MNESSAMEAWVKVRFFGNYGSLCDERRSCRFNQLLDKALIVIDS